MSKELIVKEETKQYEYDLPKVLSLTCLETPKNRCLAFRINSNGSNKLFVIMLLLYMQCFWKVQEKIQIELLKFSGFEPFQSFCLTYVLNALGNFLTALLANQYFIRLFVNYHNVKMTFASSPVSSNEIV